MSKRAIRLATVLFLTAQSLLFGQNESELAHFRRFFEPKIKVAPEQALQTATMKVEQAREIRDEKAVALALKDLGFVYLNLLHDYEKAMDAFVSALTIEDSLHMESQQALTYVAISRIFEVVGDHYKSAQFLNQALKVNEADRNINSLAMILINLGKVNAALGNLDESLACYQKVLLYREEISRSFEAEALFNLAKLYTLQGRYSDALARHKEALVVTRSVNDRFSEALFLNEIGLLYGFMRNEEKSIANHQAAFEIRQELKDGPGLAESLNNIAEFYLRQGKIDEAIANGIKALGYGQESQSREQIFKSYELLSHAYKEVGDFESSLKYKELSLAIQEFIHNEIQERQLLETQNRYVLEKKEGEIEHLEAVRVQREKELEAQKRFRNILFLLVALVLVIALLGFYLYLVKRRSNRILEAAKAEVQRHNHQLQQLNATKDKFFSIISHDLKGPLNSLTSFSHLLIKHTDSLSREEIQMLAKDLDGSVKNLFTLLENLLEWSRSQTGNIDFTPEEFNLTALLESNRDLLKAQAGAKQISIALDAPAECMVKLHKQSVNTVLRNLISNAIKFTREGGAIKLAVGRSEEGLKVTIADNGVGIPPEVVAKLFRIDTKHSTQGTANEKGTGLGLVLCREFVEKNAGKITVQSQPGRGSVFSLRFPPNVCTRPFPNISEAAAF